MVRTKTRPKKVPFMIGNRTFQIHNKIMKELKKLQNSTKLCIPKLPFGRLVRETIMMFSTTHYFRVEEAALLALQEAAEMYTVQVFEDANLCAAHARRITLRPNDMQLALQLRGDNT